MKHKRSNSAAHTARRARSPFFPTAGRGTETESPAFFHAKLRDASPGDPFEREADQVADQVVAGGATRQLHTAVEPNSRSGAAIQRDGAGTAAQRSALDEKELPAAASGAGRPLPADVRGEAEAAFGVGLGAVRIHTDEAASALSEGLGADALTHGRDIYFADGQFAPHSRAGKHLLAHELTHVVQQKSGVVQQGGTAPVIQRRPKLSAEERAAILATAAQAAFTSYEEQIDAQLDAEELLGLDSKKDKDKTYAWRLGQRDKARIQKSGTLTTEHQHEITVKIRFFSGEAKRAYLQMITGVVSEAAEGEQVFEMLAEPGIPGAQEGEEAEGLGCDAGKMQFPLLYEDEPERSTCIDIRTDKEYASNYFDQNIDMQAAAAYAVPGTTWENVEYSSFNALVVKYKNGKSEYFMLTDVGDFYFGGKTLTILEPFYYKRRATGLIYPVRNGRLYSNEQLTPNLISLKNGLRYTVKELQDLYTLVEITGAFASIIGSYSMVEGFRVSLQGFRIPRGTGKTGGGKGSGGGGQGDEPGGTVRAPGKDKGAGQPQGSGTPQKLLSSSQLKGTGKLTSDKVHPGMVRRGEATADETIHAFKLRSSNPDDRAEAQMATRLADEGYDVHFRANDKGGDLEVGGVKTDVKNPRTGNIATPMSSAAQQGADQVVIDGRRVGLTDDQVRAGIDRYEAMAQEMVVGEGRPRHPKLRELKAAFIVKGDGTIYVYRRDTSLKKAH